MLKRLLKHLSSPGWWARRAFRAAELATIGAAVKASEAVHRGEIRIAIEGPLPLRSLLHSVSCRERAGELFHSLGVAATREANGILIYVQLIDRQVEILAGHGITARVPQAEWDATCRRMLEAIERITVLLSQHFPATGDNPNELDDTPTML